MLETEPQRRAHQGCNLSIAAPVRNLAYGQPITTPDHSTRALEQIAQRLHDAHATQHGLASIGISRPESQRLASQRPAVRQNARAVAQDIDERKLANVPWLNQLDDD